MSDYPNSGRFSKNRFKREGSKQPDYKGDAHTTCPHCGKETKFEVVAWNRTAASGNRFTALKFKNEAQAAADKEAAKARKEGRAPQPANETGHSQAAPATPVEDDIPF